MSITRVAGADRGAGFVATIRLVLPDLLFVLLAVYNAIRLFRHAMWRDELQASCCSRRPCSLCRLSPCFIIVRDALRTAEFALTYFGVLLYVQLWQFPGGLRHYGILFVAFVGTVWMWRSTLPPRRAAPSLWVALLVINAVGGLTTLAWEFRPYSQSRNAATWIETMHLEDKFLMGSPDWAASSVAGYLQRPIYYLDCECFGTHVVWNEQRAQISSKKTNWSAAPSKP